MARTDPVWVFVDASYERGPEGFRGTVPALGVAVVEKSREEASDSLARAVARHLRPRLIDGSLAAHLEGIGYYLTAEGEWIPRVTGEQERLYVRVTPIEPLPLVREEEP
jgi:hypothetical protein